MPRLPLKYLIALSVFVVGGLVTGLLTWRSLALHVDENRRHQKVFAESALRLIGGVSRSALRQREYKDLQSYLNNLRRDPLLAHIYVSDAENRVVVSTQGSEIGGASPQAKGDDKYTWYTRDIPSSGGTLGRVGIRVPSAETVGMNSREVSWIVFSAIAGLSTSALVGLGLGLLISRRLDILRRAAQQFTSDGKAQKIGLHGRDEIAQLGRVFDEMVHKIEGDKAALAQREEQFRSIVDVSPAPMLICRSSDGTAAFANPKFVESFHLIPSRLAEHRLSDFCPAFGNHRALLDRLVEEGSLDGYETEARRASDEGFWVTIFIRPITFEDEPCLFCLFHDVTHRRETEEKLRQVQKLEAIGQLSSGVAHDFNNILSIILGRAEILRLKMDVPDLVKSLEVIEKAVMSGARTVKRLQNFARLRNERPKSLVDLNQVVQEVVEMTRPRWKSEAEKTGHPIDLRVVSQPGKAFVRGVAEELHEALINLLHNAMDAMPNGGTLKITTAPRGRWFRLSVSDTGVGMSKENRQRAFEPFFSTKGERGTGLGLSMVNGIVNRHNGRIDIESVEEEGTTVSLFFPSAVGDAASGDPDEIVPSAPSRLLVVDDEKAIGDNLRTLLEEEGHQVETFTAPDVALARFQLQRFDLVLTDLGMPEMNGWQVGEQVKRLRPETPVILMTGWGETPDAEMMKSPWVDNIVSKPFRRSEILNAISLALMLPKGTDIPKK